MATQSLYRRYRPRRFGEVKGQEHVVRALREAVADDRVGQAYLFSGPRGTGKTTTARILAKALNCPNVEGGEPCAECESCLAVERGTSYDVHELDAASNNGVEAIRDLIEKASLGTPGRHKVYILDEVHMLSRPAEAALLKTLEEPPAHVVFVLATTDPQKMSDTIRSRTQHLQFHLLPTDTLTEHVKWVAGDAGLELSQEALDAAITQGGGSARDTLSALELIAATGGEVGPGVDLDEFLIALAEHDTGRALTTMAQAVAVGRDPRTISEDLVRHLRNAFLALMAPELVTLPAERVAAVKELGGQIGAAALVRAIEKLGTTLVDLRNAPDPRVLVEVVLVQLTSESAAGDLEGLAARVDRLQEQVRQLMTDGPPAGGGSSGSSGSVPTGRAALGGPARQGSDAAPGSSSPAAAARAVLGGAARRRDPEAPATPSPATTAPMSEPAASAPAAPETPAAAAPARYPSVVAAWEGSVKAGLKPLVRALYLAGTFAAETPSGDGVSVRFEVPNDAHAAKVSAHRQVVEQALSAAFGKPVSLDIVSTGSEPTPRPLAAVPAPEPEPAAPAGTGTERAKAAASTAEPDEVEAPEPEYEPEEEIDLSELTDAPPETVKGPLDQLAEAFPGSELIVDE